MKSFKNYLDEKWSAKYKRSIDCANPKGFSQRAHCQGRKKNEEVEILDEKGRCWPGHRPVPGKKPFSPGSCVKEDEQIDEDLRKWFKQKWVRMDTKGNIKGQCAREPGEGKPKCLPQAKAHALGKEGRAAAARRKRREDPDPERRGKPIFVRTK